MFCDAFNDVAKLNYAMVKNQVIAASGFTYISRGFQGGFRGLICIAMCFDFHFFVAFLLVLMFSLSRSASLLMGKYLFHAMCFNTVLNGCADVGCGWVAMVTLLLLRRVLPSQLLPLRHLPHNTLIGIEFKMPLYFRKPSKLWALGEPFNNS